MEEFDSTHPIGISQKLEHISFKEMLARNKGISNVTKLGKQNEWFVNNDFLKKDSKPKTQLLFFQQTMKWIFVLGQSVGLNPIAGVLERDVSEMRFSVFTWKYLYCISIGLLQCIGVLCSMIHWIKNPNSTSALGAVSFHLTTSINTLLFLQIGTKWPGLMKEIANSSLNEYIDRSLKFKCYTICVAVWIFSIGNLCFHLMTSINILLFLHIGIKWPGLMREIENSSLNEYIDRSLKFKCYTTCVVVWIWSIVEHTLYLIAILADVGDCLSYEDTYTIFLKRHFAWYYELNLPSNVPMEIFLQVKDMIATVNWNFSDVYILCISMYLVSILEQINKKIILASEENYLPSSYWKSLREDYTRATRLVRSFDDVISGVIFISFTNYLFFICLQLFNIIKFGIPNNWTNNKNACPNLSGVFGGYESTVYFGFSTFYLVVRSLVMPLKTAGVNSASLAPITALYNVPSSSYCQEVARFINQVHANTVSLSGLRFFHVTRKLMLAMAGTIVTYELVVFQVGE